MLRRKLYSTKAECLADEQSTTTVVQVVHIHDTHSHSSGPISVSSCRFLHQHQPAREQPSALNKTSLCKCAAAASETPCMDTWPSVEGPGTSANIGGGFLRFKAVLLLASCAAFWSHFRYLFSPDWLFLAIGFSPSLALSCVEWGPSPQQSPPLVTWAVPFHIWKKSDSWGRVLHVRDRCSLSTQSTLALGPHQVILFLPYY